MNDLSRPGKNPSFICDAASHYDSRGKGIFAHTSPVYVAAGGEWGLFDAGTASYMLTLVEGGLSYIRQVAAHHPHGTVTHHHGEEDHIAHLEEPFHEAAAIHKRMHEMGIPH